MLVKCSINQNFEWWLDVCYSLILKKSEGDTLVTSRTITPLCLCNLLNYNYIKDKKGEREKGLRRGQEHFFFPNGEIHAKNQIYKSKLSWVVVSFVLT